MGDLILEPTEDAIEKAAQYIRKGKLVVYPTDTVYGLGCNALDEEAIKSVFKAKKRAPSNPLSIAVSDLPMLRKYSSFDERAMKVMECFFPGPVTFILHKKSLPDILTGGINKVGVRIPESKTTLKLILKSGVPIVTTSANISGMDPPKTAEEVMEQLPGVDLILNGGMLESKGSTIIDLTLTPPEILREGACSKFNIIEKIQEYYKI